MTTPRSRPMGLTKRYGRRHALSDCTLDIPAGRVVGLVGPNGAGKTTLLQLAAGMLTPTAGSIEVLGGRPAAGAAQLARRSGYVAQDTPTYAGLSIADHLRFGASTNPRWDQPAADGADRSSRAGPAAEGGPALRRPACSARAHPGHRETAGAAHPRRAGGQPGPDGPPGVPERTDELHRRAQRQRDPLLAPGVRSGTRLRLPDRAGRLPGTGRRRRRRPGGRPLPAHRRPAGPRRPARRCGGHRGKPHRAAVHAHRPRGRSARGRRRSPSNSSRWKTWCWRTCHRPCRARPVLEPTR